MKFTMKFTMMFFTKIATNSAINRPILGQKLALFDAQLVHHDIHHKLGPFSAEKWPPLSLNLSTKSTMMSPTSWASKIATNLAIIRPSLNFLLSTKFTTRFPHINCHKLCLKSAHSRPKIGPLWASTCPRSLSWGSAQNRPIIRPKLKLKEGQFPAKNRPILGWIYWKTSWWSSWRSWSSKRDNFRPKMGGYKAERF